MPTPPIIQTRYNVRYYAVWENNTQQRIASTLPNIDRIISTLPRLIDDTYVINEVVKISDADCTLIVWVKQDFDEPSKLIENSDGTLSIKDIFNIGERGTIIHPTFIHIRIIPEPKVYWPIENYVSTAVVAVWQKYARIGEYGLSVILWAIVDSIQGTSHSALWIVLHPLIMRGGLQSVRDIANRVKKLQIKFEKKQYQELKRSVEGWVITSNSAELKEFIDSCEAINANSVETIYSVGRETSSNLQGDVLFNFVSSALSIVQLQQEHGLKAISKCELHYHEQEASDSHYIDLIKRVLRGEIYVNQIWKKADINHWKIEIKRIMNDESSNIYEALEVLKYALN